jgi:hypothetical protein
MGEISRSLSLQAVRVLLTHFVARSGGDDQTGFLLGLATSRVWADGDPNDPAQWGDWLDAVAEAGGGTIISEGIRDGVSIRVVIGRENQIISAYPTNTKRNPK